MAIEEPAAFCIKCGTSLSNGVNFCPKCGQAREAALIAESDATSNQTDNAPAPQKDYGKAGCAIIVLAFLLLVGSVFSGVSERMGTAEVNSQNADVAVKMAERNMQDSFDSMEKIADAANSDALRIRVREIRLEWIEAKNDPNKLEVIKQKLDLLMKDVEANRYSRNASSEVDLATLDSAESISSMEFAVVNAGKGIKDYSAELKAGYEAAQRDSRKLAEFSNGVNIGKAEILIKSDKSMSQREKQLFRLNVSLIKRQTAREAVTIR